MLALYKILTAILFLIISPVLLIMHLAGSKKWSQRLGFNHPVQSKTDVWIHASSMGEVNVVDILLYYLKKRHDDADYYITVMTESGYNRAVKLFGEDRVGYLPIDTVFASSLFLNSINPARAVFIETEIWPNIVMQCRKRSIRINLANGRMSEKSFKQYSRFKSLFKPVLSSYANLMVQTEDDSKRFIAVGAAEEKTTILGNLKFDAPLLKLSKSEHDDLLCKTGFKEDDKILILGSIRNEEFETAVEISKALINNVRIIIVPRYPENIDKVLKLLADANLDYRLHSQNSRSDSNAGIFIVDVMGLLTKIYTLGAIAVVGGTYDNTGGHNILEPVWAGIPSVYGPAIDLVKESDLYIREHNFGQKTKDVSETIELLIQFFENKISFSIKEENGGRSRAGVTVRKIME